jgi:hypothetical protein
MSEISDPTSWTDREREFFALGWNECVKIQPGEIERLRAELGRIVDCSTDHDDARRRAQYALSPNVTSQK